MGIADTLISKALGVDKEEDPNVIMQRELKKHVSIEEDIIKNKIKLKALRSVSEEELDKVIGDFKLSDYMTSVIHAEIAKFVKNRAHMIAREALEDFEDNYTVKKSISDYCIAVIKRAFSTKG